MYISVELLQAYFQYLFNEYKITGLDLELTSMFIYDNDLIVNKTILNYLKKIMSKFKVNAKGTRRHAKLIPSRLC